MALPNSNINFDNGNLDTVVSSADGVFGLLASSVAVADTFALGTPYSVKGMEDVAALGILPDINNYHLYKALSEFYEEAGNGTKLWIIGFAKDTKVSDWFTPDAITGKVPAEILLDKANGEITALFTKFAPEASYTPTIENGMDADVAVAQQKAQLLFKNYTQKKRSPLFTILEAYAFNGDHSELVNIKEGSDNAVGICIGDTKKRTDSPAMIGSANQCLLGRLAKIPVSENAGRVKTGKLATLTAYILDTEAQDYDVEALHAKGYITFRQHIRKAGYYFTFDGLATNPDNDDYSRISLRRPINKAYRLAHNIASEEILEDFDLNNDGTISPFYAKAIEAKIENEIFQQMTARGELSRNLNDNNDLGVIAKFDTTSNVAQTNTINLTIKIRPKGLTEYFEVLLGYSVTLNN